MLNTNKKTNNKIKQMFEDLANVTEAIHENYGTCSIIMKQTNKQASKQIDNQSNQIHVWRPGKCDQSNPQKWQYIFFIQNNM